MRKLKFDNPEDLQEKITRYFEVTARAERPPTLSGLALFLGTTRWTLLDYIESFKGGGNSVRAQCGEMLVLAKAQIEAWLEEELVTRAKPGGIQFALANGYAGWGKQQVKVEAEVKQEAKGETKTIQLTDAELLEQIKILQQRAAEIRAREGAQDGTDV